MSLACANARVSRFARILVAALAFVLALVPLVALGGCGKSQEQVREAITQGIQADMEELSALTSETAVALFPSTYTSELQAAGVDPVTVYGPMFVDLTYSVDAVEVGDDVATVTLTVSNKDLTAAMQQYTATITNELATKESRDAFAVLGEAALTQHMAQVLASCIQGTTNKVSTTVELTYVKDGGSWVLQDSDELTSALLGGLDAQLTANPGDALLQSTEAVASQNVAAAQAQATATIVEPVA